jgi:hypothetical protein
MIEAAKLRSSSPSTVLSGVSMRFPRYLLYQ